MFVIECECCDVTNMKNGTIDNLWISYEIWDNSWCDEEGEYKPYSKSTRLCNVWDNEDLGGKMLKLKYVK